ncbi:MAG: rod shape-determining protein MreD [Bacteroidales bacterium]|nr:rod shape-determining protein MreD [Bacteroidales bacterium]MCL2133350.1 rod shape-determining protein MreD [Bacteroidales bacterium]
MNRLFFQLLALAVLLILFQMLIIDKLPLSTYISPEVYLMFILILPFKYSTIKSMLWAFALGLTIDLFSYGVLGLHIISLVAIAYLRPQLLKMVTGNNNIENIQLPSSQTLGFRPFLAYISLSVCCYLIILFCLDNYSFHNLPQLFQRIILSAMTTTLFIVVLQYAFIGRPNKKT